MFEQIRSDNVAYDRIVNLLLILAGHVKPKSAKPTVDVSDLKDLKAPQAEKPPEPEPEPKPTSKK